MSIDENGYTPLLLSDAIQLAKSKLQEKMGANLDVSDGAPMGQLAAAIGALLAQSDEELEAAYDSGFINFADGVSLDRLAGNYGLERKPATYASVDIAFVGDPNTAVDAGTVVMDDDGNEFTTIDDLILDANGNGTVTAYAQEVGDMYNVAAGKITTLQMPTSSITEVNNPMAASGGADLEDSYTFRQRILENVSARTAPTTNGVITALLNLSGVDGAYLTQNVTNQTDADGNPPYTIHFYVAGDLATSTDGQEQIAEQIFNVLPAGIQTYGAITVNVEDSTGQSHAISFSKMTAKKLYAVVSITPQQDTDVDSLHEDVDLTIRATLSDLKNGTLIYGKLLGDLYQLDGFTGPIDLKIGTAANPTGTSDISNSVIEYWDAEGADIQFE